MRKSLFFIAVFTLPTIVFAQALKDRQLFLSHSVGVGNYFGVGLAMNYTSVKDLSISSGFYAMARKARNLPNDYRGSSLLVGLDNPRESVELFYAAIGKSLLLRDELYRIKLGFGAGLAHKKLPVNYEPVANFGLFASNYTFENNSTFHPGFIQRTQAEANFTRWFGTSLGYTIIIAPEAFGLTVDLSLRFGIVRN